ncbi:hypothetical protein P3T76_007432 [Phytophthora citrophthora]|uniref:Uncharacterized protein n=1 Tax=Phytophthora citrophthora TaxID=4793 RepID=A0AAD9GPB1_9STRA|nr:hypothetical protein P3T76_007432 [Phytophthora citrophthora]
MQAADLTLQQYYAARKSRRGRAGSAWRQFLASFPAMMRDQWFDIDILLDPSSSTSPFPEWMLSIGIPAWLLDVPTGRTPLRTLPSPPT